MVVLEKQRVVVVGVAVLGKAHCWGAGAAVVVAAAEQQGLLKEAAEELKGELGLMLEVEEVVPEVPDLPLAEAAEVRAEQDLSKAAAEAPKEEQDLKT
jgi:hypothetical protein